MKLIKPLILLTVVTFLFTVTGHYLTHLPIWLLVIIGILTQFIVYGVFQNVINIYFGLQNKKIDLEILKEMSYQTATVECPCSKKHKQDILLRLNDDTKYVCGECNKTIGVFVDFSTALLTQPLDTGAENFDKLLNEAKKNVGSEQQTSK